MEFVVGLFCFLIGLFIWVAVGHGIWVLVAYLISRASARACPSCRGGLGSTDKACRRCGWTSVPLEPKPGFKVFRELLIDAQNRHLIDADTLQRGFDFLEQTESQLANQQPIPRPSIAATSVSPEIPSRVPETQPVIATIVSESSASREVEEKIHALERDYPPEPVAAPKLPPSQSWSRWFSAFMEESNIRWGELVGGLLIVCCSVALVISFWENIASRPWLKFSVFTGINVATFGLGLYAWHRWKLPTTSKGILVIGMMLLPLNFLAFALFTLGMPWDWITVGGEMVSLAALGLLAWQAARVLTPSAVWLATCTPIVFAVANLLIRRTVSEGPENPLLLYGWSVVLLGIIATTLAMVWKPLLKQADGRFAPALEFFAIATFGMLLSFGLLLRCSDDAMQSFRFLSPMLSLFAAPALLVAIHISRHIPNGSSLAIPMLSLGAVAIGIGAASMFFSAPSPARMIGSSLGWMVLIGVAAVYIRHAGIGYPVYLILSMIAVLGWYCFTGELAWLNESTLDLWTSVCSPMTGFVWVGWSIVCGAISIALSKLQSPDASLTALRSAAIIGVLGTLVLTVFGFGREAYATSVGSVYGIYAAAAFAVGMIRKKPWVEGVGIFFLAAAVVQWIVFGWVESYWMVQAYACLATISTALVIVMMIKHVLRQPATKEALLTSVTVACITMTTLLAWVWFCLAESSSWSDTAPFSIATCVYATSLWILFFWFQPNRHLWRIAQGTAIGCCLIEVVLQCKESQWWHDGAVRYLHPILMQYFGLTLFAVGGLLIALHEILRRVDRDRWKRAAGPLIDFHDGSIAHYAIASAAIATTALLAYGAIPGMLQELIPRSALETTEVVSYFQDGNTRERTVPALGALELDSIPHAAVSWGIGSDRYRVLGLPPMCAIWVVGLLTVAAAGWNVRDRTSKSSASWTALGITLLLSLWYSIASRFESSVAVASALRWLTTIVFFLASLFLSIWLQRVDRERQPEASRFFARFDNIFAAISMNAIVPWVAMVSIVVVSVLLRVPDMPWSLWAWSITGLMAMAALVLAIFQFGTDYPASQHRARSVVAITGSTLLVAPMLTWVILQVAVTVIANPLTGPNPDSIFAGMGLAASYAIPILLISFALVTVSAARPSPHLAFLSAIFLMMTVLVGYMLVLKAKGMRVEAWIGLAAALSATASIFSMIWRAYTARDKRSDALLHWSGRPVYLVREEWQTALHQVSAGFVLVGLFLVTGIVLYQPTTMPGLSLASGGIVAATCILLMDRYFRGTLAGLAPWIGALGIAGMGIVAPFPVGTERSLGSCALVMTVTGAIMIAASMRRSNPFSILIWIVGIMSCMAIRLIVERITIAGPWTGVGITPVAVMMSAWALWIANAWLYRDRWSWMFSLIAAQGAGLILTVFYGVGTSGWISRGWDTIFVQCAILALSSGIGTLLDFGNRVRIPLKFATFVLVLCSSLWLAYGLFQGDSTNLLTTFPIGSYLVAIVACIAGGVIGFWSTKSRDEHAVVYLSGLCGLVCTLQAFVPIPGMLLWVASVFLAAYCLGTSFLWRAGARIYSELVRSIRLPALPEKPPATLVVKMNVFLALIVAAMGVAAQFLQENIGIRFTCSQSIMAVAFATGILARYVSMRFYRSARQDASDPQLTGSPFIRVFSLVLGVLYAVTLFWHVQSIQATPLLDRLGVALLPLTLSGAAYGFGLIKAMGLKQEWERAAFQILPWIVALSLVGGILCLGLEYLASQNAVDSGFGLYPTLCVALSFVLVLLLCLAAAMLPGRDPLGLSERGREVYVYVTQAIIVLLIIHLRLTFPWLFSGLLQQIWPLLFLVLGFGGMGAAEWATRRGWNVLANPLRNSGSLLPLFPILASWVAASETDYGVTLVASAVGYGLFGFVNRSPIYITASALAANGAIWYVLHRSDFLFTRHPQLWVIPPALCVFVAVHWVRHRLNASQIATARYASIGSIYVASTSEILLQGIANAPWLPIVLALLSVLGILFGIAARIRSMLWLGSMFLCVALFSILWYAAVDLEQTWIWYASGIVLGAIILVVFALFEKRREDLKRIMSNMQQWEE